MLLDGILLGKLLCEKKISSILFDKLFFPKKKFIICCTFNRVKSTNITYCGVY